MGKHCRWPSRLPFYYRWIIVFIAFVTMAIGVSARTSFSLLLPPLIDEFGRDRGQVAGAFSFGFLVSAFLSPLAGRMMDRHGPRMVIETGVCLLSGGLLLAQATQRPWQLYATLGVMVGGGANLMSFTAQSLYLPYWFLRRRGLAISIAFAGVGVGAVLLLPWFQTMITQIGWRAACRAMGLLALLVLAPLNLFVWRQPEDIGLLADGVALTPASKKANEALTIVDPIWTSAEWTLTCAARTGRFWWIVLGYFCALFAWYAVQVHQTKYLTEIGFNPLEAAWVLGMVSVIAIPGQIGLGALSDHVGREWIWSAGCCGFAICYAALIALEHAPSYGLLYLMVISQGFLGYALTSVMGPIVAEVFDGPHYGSIFGTVTIALIGGGAAGPWVTGIIHDAVGTYRPAFILAMVFSFISMTAIWVASPRKVRQVPGRAIGKLPAGGAGANP
jgi:MFS family permease